MRSVARSSRPRVRRRVFGAQPGGVVGDAPECCDEVEELDGGQLPVERRLVGDVGEDLLRALGLGVDVEPGDRCSAESGRRRPASMRREVVLPAPLAPRKA
jgi:hypothetical protein